MSGFPCVFCGANLDAGEKCDCERAVKLRGPIRARNVNENRGVYTCGKCQSGIYDGEWALVWGKHKLCEECLEEMTGKDVIDFLDLPFRKVELEELM